MTMYILFTAMIYTLGWAAPPEKGHHQFDNELGACTLGLGRPMKEYIQSSSIMDKELGV